jgi:hypothetical protein
MLTAVVVALRSVALCCRGHRAVALENLALRQQLAVLQRRRRKIAADNWPGWGIKAAVRVALSAPAPPAVGARRPRPGLIRAFMAPTRLPFLVVQRLATFSRYATASGRRRILHCGRVSGRST